MQNDKLDNYLRTYRKKLGLTQREVAFLLGCHSGAKVSRYERSGRIPASGRIFAYEAIFQKPARELFAGIYARAERQTMRNLRMLVSRLRKRQESPALARKIASLRAVVEGEPKDLRYEPVSESMMDHARPEIRVLSIDPHPRGFGYAVFEGPARLVDWGTKDVRKDKEQVALHKIDRTGPGIPARGDRRRGLRPREVSAQPQSQAAHRKHSRRGPRVRRRRATLPLAAVYRAFAGAGAGTKYGIATALVRAFPELMVRLPPKRKPWQSEDSRMSIFDAVALGLTYFRTLRRTKTAFSPDAHSRNADHSA